MANGERKWDDLIMTVCNISDSVTLYHADMREALRDLPDNSIDSVVCDPPYHLTSIVKRFGGKNAAPAKYGTDGAFVRASKGFMCTTWDGGDIAFRPDTWAEVLRVLKPGGYCAAFGAPRNFGRLQVALFDAGFEERDTILNLVGPNDSVTQFIESLDESQLDAFAKCMASSELSGMLAWTFGTGFPKSKSMRDIGRPELGTALKPAFEPIVLARKPLSEGTVAANVLRWGTGALNIDGTRIGADGGGTHCNRRDENGKCLGHPDRRGTAFGLTYHGPEGDGSSGRWPANVVHDGSDEVVGAFPQSNSSRIGNPNERTKGKSGIFKAGDGVSDYRDSGSAARFFYSAKASRADRAGSKHPTIKPIALMQWLARLITPPGGTVLDPFAGSGTTGAAAEREGFHAVLIEREAEYVEDIKRRLSTPALPQVVAAVAAQQPANDNQPRDLFGAAA